MENELKLHLGCGIKRLEGFQQVDVRPECNPDHVADVMALPFDADTVELIYFSHGLEHIRRPNVMDALAEWRRVLKPGGILRLAMPDFEALSGVYHDERVHLIRIQGLLWGRQNYNGNTHYCGWDFETLAHTLSEAGYFNISKWHPHRVLPEGFDDFSMCKINGVSVSLNVEAIAK